MLPVKEEEAFCLGRIACFGLLIISLLFRQLCQHQAHAVNHQPTKCGTADFHNRQNGTSLESYTFSIKFLQLASSSMFSIDNYVYEEKPSDKNKKTKTKKPFFPAQFSERWLNHELLSFSDSQCDVLFFRYQNIHKFQPFSVLALLCLMQ